MYDKWNIQAVLEMCAALSMPAEATAQVERVMQIAPDEPAAGAAQLTVRDTAADACRAITERLEGNPDKGWLMLALSMQAACISREEYRRRGIPEDVFIDTMKCFTRFVGEHMAYFGRYGFDRFYWTYRQLSGTIYRLGELEIDLACGQQNAVGIHIPSDAHLTRESCMDSFRRGCEFMARFYPDFEFDRFHCHTWLLSPELGRLLDEGSHIRAFQSFFDIYKVVPEDEGYRHWLYKNRELEPKDFPEHTTLQRRVKAHVLAGGHIGSAAGNVPLSAIE